MAVAAAGSMVIVNTVVYVRDQLGRGETDTALAFRRGRVGFDGACPADAVFCSDRSGDRPIMLGGGVCSRPRPGAGSSGAGFLGTADDLDGARRRIIDDPDAGGTAAATVLPCGRPTRALRRAVRAVACVLAHRLSARRLAWRLIRGSMSPSAFWRWSSPARRSRRRDYGRCPTRSNRGTTTMNRLTRIRTCTTSITGTEHEGWEGPEPHSHPHRHPKTRHRHALVIDMHHRKLAGVAALTPPHPSPAGRRCRRRRWCRWRPRARRRSGAGSGGRRPWVRCPTGLRRRMAGRQPRRRSGCG